MCRSLDKQLGGAALRNLGLDNDFLVALATHRADRQIAFAEYFACFGTLCSAAASCTFVAEDVFGI